MDGVGVGDIGGEVSIEYHRYRLPHHLRENYAVVVPSPFWD